MKRKTFLIIIIYLLTFNISVVNAGAAAASELLDEYLPPEINAGSAVILDAETGVALYDKDMDARRFPASTTKVMTALLTIEHCEDLDAPLTMSYESINSLPWDASVIDMQEGEVITINDALYGLLLESANEIANALAEHIAGSVEDFAELMNRRAAQLGAVNTHFDNPTGLFSEEHYTTARDIALIMREAVKHPLFNEIIATAEYEIPPTNLEEARELTNTNRLILEGPYYNEIVTGGKTGFLDESKHTLVVHAVRDGRPLIVSVMFADRNENFNDANLLLDYICAVPFEDIRVLESEAFAREVPVYQTVAGERVYAGNATLTPSLDLYANLPFNFNKADIRYEIEIPDELNPPVNMGDGAGYITCYIQDYVAGVVKMEASNAVTAVLPPFNAEPGEINNETVPALANTQPETPEMEMNLDEAALNETALNGETGETNENGAEDAVIADEPAAAAPLDSFYDFLLTMALPLGVSALALVISFILLLTRRRRKRDMFTYRDERRGGREYRYR